jgi:putative GTP pyrophosphokinase
MFENRHSALIEWYKQNINLYRGLTKGVERILRDLIEKNNIDCLNVVSRTKSPESFVEKVGRKGYVSPDKETTDLAGIRLITYVESDVIKLRDLINSTFNVHPDKSVDKTDAMNVDQVGYRSIHFVCDLGEARVELPEFSNYKNMLFEIQVRTMLQHAWAEIHYSRDYKFSGVLPRYIRRRLYCLAGALELIDMNFAMLAREVDNYSNEVEEKVLRGDLDIEINSTSLLKYLSIKLRPLKSRGVELLEDDYISKTLIDELENFRIHALSGLDKILSDGFLEAVVDHQTYTTFAGSLRDAMIYADIDYYFSTSWNNNWQEAESYTFEMLKDKYSDEKVETMFRERDISWN